MAEVPEYFDNVIIGQFVLTGMPIKVYVNGGYLTITDPDDIEDAEIGFGMDTDGAMHSFDYRTVDHVLVGDQHIDLATYKKASEDEKLGAEKPAEEEKSKDKKEGGKANPFEGKQNMKLKSLIEKSVSQDQQQLFGTALSVKRGDTPKSDVSKTITKLAAALPEKELAKFAGTKHKDLPKKKVEEYSSISDVSEPYSIQVGDMIQNINPNCMHYGSMGIVQKIMDLPNDMAQVVKYSVTNSGDTYKAGDTLMKTMDQLSAIEDEDWNDDMEDWDVVDIDMSDDDDFNLGKTDPSWNDEDMYDDDDEEELTEAARVPSNVMEFAKRKGQTAVSLVKNAATWAEKAGKYISDGTAIGKNYSTIILDMTRQGSEIRINLDTSVITLFDKKVTDAKSFAKVLATNESAEVNEASKDEQKAAIEAAKAKMEQGKAMMAAAKEDMKAAKDMKVEG